MAVTAHNEVHGKSDVAKRIKELQTTAGLPVRVNIDHQELAKYIIELQAHYGLTQNKTIDNEHLAAKLIAVEKAIP